MKPWYFLRRLSYCQSLIRLQPYMVQDMLLNLEPSNDVKGIWGQRATVTSGTLTQASGCRHLVCVCVCVCVSNRSVFITSSLLLFLPSLLPWLQWLFDWNCPPPCYQLGTIIRFWLHSNNQLYYTPLPLIDQQSWSGNHSSGAHRAACSWRRAGGVKEYSGLNAEHYNLRQCTYNGSLSLKCTLQFTITK